MIRFSAHSPFLQIQFVTTFWTAIRVLTWHRGAGKRSFEFSKASKATHDSRVPDLTNNDEKKTTGREKMLTSLSLGLGDVGDIGHVPDIGEMAARNVPVANDR